jgi:hypothetical protein
MISPFFKEVSLRKKGTVWLLHPGPSASGSGLDSFSPVKYETEKKKKKHLLKVSDFLGFLFSHI